MVLRASSEDTSLCFPWSLNLAFQTLSKVFCKALGDNQPPPWLWNVLPQLPPLPSPQPELYFNAMNCKMGFWDLRPRGWNFNAHRLVSAVLLSFSTFPQQQVPLLDHNWRHSLVFFLRTFFYSGFIKGGSGSFVRPSNR